jgi:primosomal protein N'
VDVTDFKQKFSLKEQRDQAGGVSVLTLVPSDNETSQIIRTVNELFRKNNKENV